jgi:hypothetical protein
MNPDIFEDTFEMAKVAIRRRAGGVLVLFEQKHQHADIN